MRLNPAVRMLVFACVLGALVGVGWLVKPSSPAAQVAKPVRVPVDSTTLVCPEASFASGNTSTNVSAVAVPAEPPATPRGAPALSTAATLSVGGLVNGGTPASVKERQQVARYNPKVAKPTAVAVRARGVLAPGVTAGQVTRSEEGAQHGLSEAACTAPAAEFWFVGAGSAVGRHSRLYLTNVDNTKATVDLQLYDEKGPIKADASRGIDVAPGKQVVLELDEYAPTSQRLAVDVQVTQGRLAAAMRDQVVSGSTPAGIDWIPASTAPGRDFVVPGVVQGTGKRTLTLVAPGESTAVVDLGVYGEDGSFEPAELGRLEIDPGTVAQVALEKVTQEQASSIRVRSDVPVAASVRNETNAGEDGVRDVAFGSASVPLTTTGVVPLTIAPGRATLLLTNPGKAQTAVDVVLQDENGKQVAKTSVAVGPGATAAKALAAPSGVSRYVTVVTPEPGQPVYAVRVVSDSAGGPMLSAYPVTAAPATVLRPVARPELGIAARR